MRKHNRYSLKSKSSTGGNMLSSFNLKVLAIGAAIATLFSSVSAAQSPQYQLIKTIDLPGTTGGHGDWVTYDPDTETVWLAQSPDHNVVVIDAKTLAVKNTITGVDSGNGIDIDKQYAFVTDATTGKLIVVDKKTFKKVAVVDSGGKTPDGVNIDTRTGKVFVANDDSNNEAVFDSKAPFARSAVFKLKPEDAKDGPDVALYVRSTDRLYQPVGGSIDVIDPNTNTIVAVWDFGVKSAAKGGVFDSKTNHLIFGTGDKKMLVVDVESGKLVTTIPVAGAVDQSAIDVAKRRAFLGDKTGNIEVVDLDSNQVVDYIAAEKNAHTLAVDTKMHRVFIYLNASNKVGVYEPKL
jgi:DNA-binding beta-propeller fold protein YncE